MTEAADATSEHPDDVVDRIGADAQDAHQALLAEPAPQRPEIGRLRDKAARLAAELDREARDRIAIGIVGEFGVGKSMLVGTLLGRPDLLPVEERATTGNITALYLEPGTPGTPTRKADRATVHYLTLDELADCAVFMCQELAAKTLEVRHGTDVTAILDRDPVREGWDAVEQWCQRVLWPAPDEPGSLEPRKIAAELLALRDAHLSAAAVLGGRVDVADKVVRAALDLGSLDAVPRSFPRRDVRPGLELDDVPRDSAALARTFPLIRRVSYTVQVDPQCWRLDGLTGRNGIVLLDFPGLTSTRSDRRDRFLSRTELGRVHTIITVFGSAKPGNNVPHTFFSMLESHGHDAGRLRDYIIAVGNAFDVIPAPEFSHDAPLTLDDVKHGSQRFADLAVNASELIQHQDSRIRLVSSVVAVGKYGYPTDFSEHQRTVFEQARQSAADRQWQWGRIGRRLEAGEPGNPWAASLAAFADDGGIASLRELIRSHARAHGLANKIDALRTKRRRLEEALEQVESLLPPEETGADEAARDRILIDQLCDEFRRWHAALTENAAIFREPLRLAAAGAPVIESARSGCVTEVMTWQEWHNLIQRADRGVIPWTAAQSSNDSLGWITDVFGQLDDTTSSDTTEALFGRFSTAYSAAVEQARADLKFAVAEWTRRQEDDCAVLRDRLDDPQVASLFAAGRSRLAAAGGPLVNWAGALRALVDFGWARQRLDKTLPGAIGQDQIAAVFPLRRDRALPWHPAMYDGNSDPEHAWLRHQSHVFRTQRELATAGSYAVSRTLTSDIAAFAAEFGGALQRFYDYIPKPEQVREMFPLPPEDPGEAAADPGGGGGPRPAGSPLRSLLREWRARNARPGI